MKKKITQIFIALTLLAHTASAQSTSQNVLANAGDHFTAGNMQLEWTLGELAVESHSAGSYMLTEGFHQGYILITSVSEQAPQVIANAYPNPAYNEINLVFFTTPPAQITITLYDITGKAVLKQNLYDVARNVPVSIDVQSLTEGVYLLEVNSGAKTAPRVFKIQKIN